MSKALSFLGLTFTLLAALPPVAALAQADRGPAAQAAAPELPAGHVPRYRLTYMTSQSLTAIRSATVVSITNQSGATCVTSVDWRFGLGGGAACTTTLSLGPAQTGEHCSRPLPDEIANCNATCSPALTAIEGNAVIGSRNIAGCDRIAVDARIYYTTGATDTAVSAVSHPNIVKRGVGNIGD